MFGKIKQVLSAILLTITSFILVAYISIFPFAFNPTFYSRYYDATTIETSRLDIETLKMLIERTLDFTLGKINEFQMVVKTIDDISIYAFTNKAVAHMIEVQRMFTNGRVLVVICLFAFLFILAYVIMHRKQIKNIFFNTMLISLSVITFIIFATLLYALIDFNAVWINFHFLLFDNYNWVLSKNEILGLIMPEKGFFLVAVSAILTYLGITIVQYFLIIIFKIRDKNNTK